MTAELGPKSKKARKEQPIIHFTDEDMEGVRVPHNDPLILTLKLKHFKVQRILVDPGNSSEILYFECFKRMDLGENDLQEARTP